MCGVAGFIDNLSSELIAYNSLARMGDAIRSRGPDAEGAWVDVSSGVGLVHRRLSILELTNAGAQPMHSRNGRYVIVFNGEIYNHQSIRAELFAHGYAAELWKGCSDTETLIEAISVWGVKETLQKCQGMFAFAVWDRFDSKLILGRDRIGEKPLYYGFLSNGLEKTFLFASDVNSLRRHEKFQCKVDRSSLAVYLRYGYIPAPLSIYEGIYKLRPGCILVVTPGSDNLVPEEYWSFTGIVEQKEVTALGFKDASFVLEELLTSAVGQQMQSDVPLGAFLSGGVDSSTIVALMQKQSITPVKSFSIGFNEEAHNEAVYAGKVASFLGTEHHELYVQPWDALNVIPMLPEIYGEPFADSSQIPTYLVSKLAKEYVTVSLSGDAGDELFCGYSRYSLTNRVWSGVDMIPYPLRKIIAGSISMLPVSFWNGFFYPVKKANPNKFEHVNFGDKLYKAARIAKSENIYDVYSGFLESWCPEELLLDYKGEAVDFKVVMDCFSEFNADAKMMALDTLTYLPDDILVKVDRAAMFASLETRVPLLDHRVVEFAWSLPHDFKYRAGVGKYILRDVLYRYVPRELIERPKKGFAVPIADWLRGPLKDWAESLLDESRIRKDGFFKPEPIIKKWMEHKSGKRNWQRHLWIILMFQAWLNNQ